MKTLVILSGKGGVGKSSVAVNLAFAISSKNLKVGILDLDLTGPSIPYMLNIDSASILQTAQGWTPVQVNEYIYCMSIAFLLKSKNDSVVWRGPKKTSVIQNFIEQVNWPDIDYLIIDTPPGTSDEHITIAQQLQHKAAALLVTTPQLLAAMDVRKELNFCLKVGLPIVGIVENMSGYVCPNCQECTNIFSSGGGMEIAKAYDIPFLGRIPIHPSSSDHQLTTFLSILHNITWP